MIRAVPSLVTLALLFVAPSLALGELLFADSFESGDASAWTYHKAERVGFVSSGCKDGTWCSSHTAHKDSCDQGLMVEQQVDFGGRDIYVKTWWKFPVGYSFTKSDACQASNDHKAIIFETTTNRDRCFLNFRGPGPDRSGIRFYCGPGNGGWESGNDFDMVADGMWHSIQVHLQRSSGGGHVRVWYDDLIAIDSDYLICQGSCPTITAVKIGAYINYGTVKTQTFYVDDVVIATTPISGNTTPISGNEEGPLTEPGRPVLVGN